MPREFTPENVYESLLQKIETNQHLVDEALKHNEILLDKTVDNFEKRLKELNGVRETFRDYTLTAMPRSEVLTKFDAMAEKQADALKPIQTRIESYGKPNYSLWLTGMTVVGAVIGGAWLVINLEIAVVSAPLQLATEQLKVADIARDRSISDLALSSQKNSQEILNLNQITAAGNQDRIQLNERTRIAEANIALSGQADAASKSDRAQLNDRLKSVEVEMSNGKGDRRAKEAAIEQKLVEIETQFTSVESVIAMAREQTGQFITLMWNKIFPDNPFPRGTYNPTLHKNVD